MVNLVGEAHCDTGTARRSFLDSCPPATWRFSGEQPESFDLSSIGARVAEVPWAQSPPPSKTSFVTHRSSTLPFALCR